MGTVKERFGDVILPFNLTENYEYFGFYLPLKGSVFTVVMKREELTNIDTYNEYLTVIYDHVIGERICLTG